ncbi:outer membrane protein [Legionella oakridgensis ATCC 33761 = DSM 21215]|uniref:Translocation and assembly module subunit TamA n=2 Tax=Legionella oakridgensis TaxID=29423 RepID=W0BDN3_9GAMM|nr:outer membrane protein [Legionella oakridgensis ATCC 33761 = DSM 21215]
MVLAFMISKRLGRLLLLLIGCVLQLSASYAVNVEITGIKGSVLENVQYRLNELYENKPISQEPVEALKEQITKAMYPYGFFQPTITIYPAGKRLQIYIIPGPQMRINSLNVRLQGEGADNAEIKQAMRDLPIKVGQPLLNHRYEEAKDMLSNAAEHQGYLHAFFEKSEILIDRQHYTADITLIFNTGPQYYFGQIRFDPTYISPELLHRYVPFKYGEPYSTDQILALETTLSASGYFKSVIVKPNIDSIRHVPVDVHLERVHRINYSLGIGYGTDTGPRGRAGLDIMPVNRSGHKFNAIAQGSFKENALLAQYIIPGQNPVTDKYSVTGSLSNLNYSSGYGNSLLLSVAKQHVKKNHQRMISLNALNERFNYTGEPKTTKSLLFPKAMFTWSQISDPLFSPSGYNITLTGLAASKAVLSEINVAQAFIDVKAAFTAEMIRTRFFFHAIQGFTLINNVDNLPLSLALLLGGAEDLKAYSYNSVGPGKILSFAGMEIQKETFKKWYLIGFVDGGDVYKPSLKDFKYDAGIGLMWVSPVGPIKVGIAQPINNHFNCIQGRNPKLVINMGPDL